MRLRSRGSSFHNRPLLIASYFLCALVALLFLSITASAEDQKNSTGKSAASEDSPPSFSQVPVDQSQGAPPRWTVSADALILYRIGYVNRTLVERVPGTVPLPNLATTPGTEVLNSNNFRQGFSPGARINVIRHGDSGCDLETRKAGFAALSCPTVLLFLTGPRPVTLRPALPGYLHNIRENFHSPCRVAMPDLFFIQSL